MLGGGSLFSKLKRLLVVHKKEAAVPPRLPDEIYLEIFLRLPAKSTFTCKCVSKTWLYIISSPDFVKLHLDYTLKINNENPRLMLSGYDSKMDEILMYIITKNALFSTTKFYDKAVVMEHHHPFNSKELVGIVGTCNGLVCLWLRKGSTDFFSLWNPTTKEYKIIPDSPQLDIFHDHPECFCYDYKNDDYKLFFVGIPSFALYVYTLRSNSWKPLQSKPYSPYNVVLVNDALYWIDKTPEVIVSFDVSDERFKETQLPGEIMEKMHLNQLLILKVLEGCLCVIHVERDEAWVMREYGVWESWTKHENKIVNQYKHLKWSSKAGDCLIYSEGTDLDLYDPKNSSARRLKLGSLKITYVYSYVESLVSLNTSTYLGRTKVIGTRRRSIWGKRSIMLLVLVMYFLLWLMR